MARLAFRRSASDIGPFDVCLGRGRAMNGNPPEAGPGVLGVLGDDSIPPGVFGPPSLASDPHPGVFGVEGDGELNPDHPARVGKFLIGCGIGGEVMRLVRCRVGFAGRLIPLGVMGVANAGETGVGDIGGAAIGVDSDVVDVGG